MFVETLTYILTLSKVSIDRGNTPSADILNGFEHRRNIIFK